LTSFFDHIVKAKKNQNNKDKNKKMFKVFLGGLNDDLNRTELEKKTRK